MIRIAFFNMTAGVGSSTLAVNLAWHLYKNHGRRVLLIDLDPQFTTTSWVMGVEAYDDHRNKYGTVTDILLDLEKAKGNVSSKIMYPVEVSQDKKSFLLCLPAEPELIQVLDSKEEVEPRLRYLLRVWGQNFDFVLIDCAPSQTRLTTVGLLAGDCVMVPVSPDRYSILGLGITRDVLKQVTDKQTDMKVAHDLGVVYTRSSRKASDLEQGCKEFVKDQAPYVFKAEIPAAKRVDLRAIHSKGIDTDTRFALELPKQALGELALEMDSRIRALWPILKKR